MQCEYGSSPQSTVGDYVPPQDALTHVVPPIYLSLGKVINDLLPVQPQGACQPHLLDLLYLGIEESVLFCPFNRPYFLQMTAICRTLG